MNIGLAALLEGLFYARLHQKLLRCLHLSENYGYHVSESGNITYGHSARRGCLPCSIRVSSLFQVQIFPCVDPQNYLTKMTSEVISEVGEGKCLSLIYCL